MYKYGSRLLWHELAFNIQYKNIAIKKKKKKKKKKKNKKKKKKKINKK